MSSINNSINSLVSIDLEKHCLAGLIKHSEIFPEIDNFITEDCFYSGENKEHKVIFSVIKQLILSNTKFDCVLLAQKISELNINFNNGELSIFDYLEAISQFDINKEACIESFKELAKLKYLRDEYYQAEKVKKAIISNRAKPVLEIISEIDKLKNEKTNKIFRNKDEFTNIYTNLESLVEGIADNPPDITKYWYGPFDSVNRIYGSLHRPGNFTLIGARSGGAKTSLALYYNTYIAEKYDIPVYHADQGEMTIEELQMRAVCMLTGGRVPMWCLENGTWRDKKEWKDLVRQAWPRVKKIKFYYHQTASLEPIEIINSMRRFSYNVVGRDNPFLADYDYLKPLNADNHNQPEWKMMGHFIQDIKSFITNEINIPFWASLQLNRSGIVTNKTADQIDDSENSFSISDRILQQASHSFILRLKAMDELAFEGNQFGNLKMINCGKKRHLGRDYFDAINPVEYEKGKYKANYINLNHDSFHFEDRGDFKSMVKALKDKYEVQPDNGENTELV